MSSSVKFETTDHKANVNDDALIVLIDLTAIAETFKGTVNSSDPYYSLYSQAFSLQDAVEAATAKIKANNLTFAEAEWQKANAQARDRLDAHTIAANQEIRYKNKLQKAISDRDSACALLTARQNVEPNLSMYPLPAEIEAWKQSVATAQEAVDKAFSEYISVSGE